MTCRWRWVWRTYSRNNFYTLTYKNTINEQWQVSENPWNWGKKIKNFVGSPWGIHMGQTTIQHVIYTHGPPSTPPTNTQKIRPCLGTIYNIPPPSYSYDYEDHSSLISIIHCHSPVGNRHFFFPGSTWLIHPSFEHCKWSI